jgi:hypothetical protein
VVDCQVSAVGLAATLSKENPTIPTKIENLADMFLADKARGLPVHGLQNLAIKLQDGMQQP